MCVGEIPATLHSKVYEEYQSEVIPGTVLLLRKVVLRGQSYCVIAAVCFVRCRYSAHLREEDTLM